MLTCISHQLRILPNFKDKYDTGKIITKKEQNKYRSSKKKCMICLLVKNIFCIFNVDAVVIPTFYGVSPLNFYSQYNFCCVQENESYKV